MATVSSSLSRKPKKHVYGRAHGKLSAPSWTATGFFDEDELAASEPTRPQQSNVESTYSVTKTEAKMQGVKSSRPRPKRQDTFDVPSSDDDLVVPTATLASPPRSMIKSSLVDDTDTSTAQLAPWERNRVQNHQSVETKKGRVGAASPEAQLRQDLKRATMDAGRNKSATNSPDGGRVGAGATTPPSNSVNQHTLSAAARLASRRDAPANSAKRTVLGVDDLDGEPRKRPRTVTASNDSTVDLDMTDRRPVPTCELPGEESKRERDVNVFDISSSGDEMPQLRSKKQSPKSAKKPTRRGNTITYSKTRTAQTAISAPGRLSEMLATDTDTTEPPTRSPSATSRFSTPQKQLSTPPGKAGSPETAVKAAGTMTPKQRHLWSQLLPSDPVVPSPSALPIDDLSISGMRNYGPRSLAMFSRRGNKSSSHVPARRRTRLVDRLKASAPSSDEESSDEDNEDAPEIVEDNPAAEQPVREPERPTELKRLPSQTSQSQVQTTGNATRGPKITYSSVRSFLPEDDIGQDFMAGLASETPQHATQMSRFGKPAPVSQKSAFDMDDSDDENTQGKIRTIHELRASGRTMAGMYDIEELLSEIQNHNASHRSRRRSALIELATKLCDKAFAVRFVGQSLEVELARECALADDEIAEFVLAAAVALMLASGPPEHTVRALHEQDALTSVARLLDRDTAISKVAKERRNNMSKAAQGSLLAFADLLKKQTSLWSEEMPKTITSRLVALKALDLLIGKMRRLGDRSDLLDANQVQLVLHNANVPFERRDQVEMTLSISILESLSTTAASLNWPFTVLHTLADILPRLNTDTASSRHALFLTLRLCLNLTNENARNCQLITASPIPVTYLLNSIKFGFTTLDAEIEDEKRALALDLLVLTMGIMINLAEHCDNARRQAVANEETLQSLVEIFQIGQKNMLEAESVEESVSNVTFGYLAVMLSNICQDKEAETFIASRLPGKNLGMLVEAVAEFVRHHERVDGMNLAFEGEEGRSVWGGFTEKLRGVLGRLREVESEG